MTAAPAPHAHPVRLGVLGHGVVGAAFVDLVARRAGEVRARAGVDLRVVRVAVRDLGRHRGLPSGLAVTDPHAVAEDPEVDVVVELMGGLDPAREIVATALGKGKPVVTANKALLARHGAELFAAADAAGTDLLFEAAVCGGIPLIRPLRESLRGEPIERILGIVNGTTNYVLTQMSERGAEYADALADVHAEGIPRVTAADIAIARRFGFAVKPLGVAERRGADGAISVRVHPALVPLTHPLASVRGAFNAVVVDGAASGSLMFYGSGAGGDPTASAVLGDVIDAAVNLRKGTHAPLGTFAPARLAPMGSLEGEYMIGLEVADRPGVLHAVTGVFARNAVSIRAAEQDGIGTDARLVFLTHRAGEAAVQACLAELRGLDVVTHVGALLRVIPG